LTYLHTVRVIVEGGAGQVFVVQWLSAYRSHAARNQHVCMIAMSAYRLLFGRVIIVGLPHLHCNLGLINL
jgi:hypothetical protein